MTNPIVVSVAKLRGAALALLDEVEVALGPTIDLDADHHWELNAQAAFDLRNEPAGEISVGQLSDDIEAFVARLPDPIVVWHELGHLIGILRRLAALDLPRATNGG